MLIVGHLTKTRCRSQLRVIIDKNLFSIIFVLIARDRIKSTYCESSVWCNVVATVAFTALIRVILFCRLLGAEIADPAGILL